MNALIKTIEIIGTFAFALSGIIEARKKGMDIVGVYKEPNGSENRMGLGL